MSEAAHTELMQLLQNIHLKYVTGSGSEQSAKWDEERSCFTLSLVLDPAKDIGRYFDQDAIVRVGPDAASQLILLRPIFTVWPDSIAGES